MNYKDQGRHASTNSRMAFECFQASSIQASGFANVPNFRVFFPEKSVSSESRIGGIRSVIPEYAAFNRSPCFNW